MHTHTHTHALSLLQWQGTVPAAFAGPEQSYERAVFILPSPSGRASRFFMFRIIAQDGVGVIARFFQRLRCQSCPSRVLPVVQR